LSEPIPKIALTGASGVLGRTLQETFPQWDWHLFEGDITSRKDTDAWAKGLAEKRVEALLHLAALVPTSAFEPDPVAGITVNVLGTCHLLHSLRAAKCEHFDPWFFLASTSHVYASQPEPLREDSPLAPTSAYGLSKLQSEQWVMRLARSASLRSCIGRIFSFSSPYQPTSYFLPSMLKKIANAEKNAVLEIPGLQGKRDLSSATEMANAIGFLLMKKAEGTFNIASGKSVLLRDAVQSVAHYFDRTDITIQSVANETHPPTHLTADVSRLQELGYEAAPLGIEALVASVAQRPVSVLSE
jgi:nucleoside-diphosphate-sugar epimerase